MNPCQPPRLIAGRSYHRLRPRPTDDDRLPPQLRPPPQLHRRVESVHVEMRNRALEAHPTMVGGTRDGLCSEDDAEGSVSVFCWEYADLRRGTCHEAKDAAQT